MHNSGIASFWHTACGHGRGSSSHKEFTMATRIHSVLHADHRHWQEEIDMWQLDIEEWEKERAKLMADLEVALGAEVTGLQNHAQAITDHQERVSHHEQFIAELDRSERPTSSEIEARM